MWLPNKYYSLLLNCEISVPKIGWALEKCVRFKG